MSLLGMGESLRALALGRARLAAPARPSTSALLPSALRCSAHPSAAAAPGNPLLDISAVVPAEMLTKYHVKPGDIVLAGAANGGHDDQLQVYDVRSPPALRRCSSG